VNNAPPVWCHSPPVTGGHVQAVVEAPETLPPLGDVPRRHATNHMDVSVPHVEVLASEDIPIAVQQCPAPLFVKALQPLDIERVVLHQVRVVLSLRWDKGNLYPELVLPDRIGSSTVNEHPLEPQVSHSACDAVGAGLRPRLRH